MNVNPPKRSVALENAEPRSQSDLSVVATGTTQITKSNPFILPIIIILSIIVVDQLTKIWAVDALTNQPPTPIVGEFLRFTLVYNYGGAMGTSFGPSHFYLITALVILPALFFYLYQTRHQRIVALPLSFIAGGALGNVIDRLRIGKVVDFIDVDFFDLNLFGYQLDRWWTFNIADAAITCSIIFILVTMFLPRHRIQAARSENPITPSTDTPVT